MGRLTGKTAIVTGGGQGIGRGITDRFVEEGAKVFVAQRSNPTNLPSEAIFVETDLRQSGSIEELCATVLGQSPSIDVFLPRQKHFVAILFFRAGTRQT